MIGKFPFIMEAKLSFRHHNVGHHLDPLPDISSNITLPLPSQADRKVPAVSSAHCTGHMVLGDKFGVKLQAESLLEVNSFYLLNSISNVVSIREQVIFEFGWPDKKIQKHVFDAVVRLETNDLIAFAIKPERRLNSIGRDQRSFEEHMQAVAWWAYELDFVDEVRILTECDLDPVVLHNAKVMAAVRDSDVEADGVARDVLFSFPLGSGLSFRDLTIAVDLGARGYRALIRLLRQGVARLRVKERISPSAVIVNARNAKLISHIPNGLRLTADRQPVSTVAQVNS